MSIKKNNRISLDVRMMISKGEPPVITGDRMGTEATPVIQREAL